MRKVISFAFALAFSLTVVAFASHLGEESTLAAPASAKKMAAMHNDAGIKAYETKDYAESEAHFRMAVKIDPNFAEAHYNLGLALHGQKNHNAAAVEFKLAKKLAPNNKALVDSKILEHHLNM
ncbi:MAG: tetratricopeptide repeat protein [Nitrospinae bacterium]|nr:tetratricopeptide repeat protein [Nitrospinota bacterium]